MRCGGIVLCGGASRRMGRPKALLPFGDEVMLQRVVRILGEVVDPIVVVAAPSQQLPELPAGVLVARDEEEYRGPLAGLGVGLKALAGRCDAAYCSSCDVPLLRSDFVRAMINRLGEHDLAVPRDEKFFHPLAAVYRTRLAAQVQELVAADRLRPLFLIEESDSVVVPVDELRGVDGELDSLRNVNEPESYADALMRAGMPVPGQDSEAPYRIRLRGPWEVGLGEAGTRTTELTRAHLPCSWRELFGDRAGTAVFRRRFNRPTNLDAESRVCIVLTGVSGEVELRVNDVAVMPERRGGGELAFPVMELLEQHNQLEILVTDDPAAHSDRPGGLCEPVAIEIG